MSRRRTALAVVTMVVLAIAGVGMIILSQYQPPTMQVSYVTSSPTALPTAAPTEAPSPTPVPPWFGPIAFDTGAEGGQAMTAFPSGTNQVYASWRYRNMVNGTVYALSWFLDGNQWSYETLIWDTGQYGSEGIYSTHIGEHGASELPPGRYRLELLIGAQPMQAATFVVRPPMPTAAPPTATPQPDIQALGRQATQALVRLRVPSDRSFTQGSQGSGSIVDGQLGLIVTNWHVVSDWWGNLLNEAGYALVDLTLDPDMPPVSTYWARVLPQYSDPDRDLALLQIKLWERDQTAVAMPMDLPGIPIGDSDLVRTGDRVLLLGFPDYAGDHLSWTEGVVATHDTQWIKTDAEVSHGHSGGMMLNDRGELIGIPTQYETTSVGDGLALARPINWARSLVQSAGAGWVSPLPAQPSPGDSAAGERMVVLGVESLNLRDGPGMSYTQVAVMPRGTVVQVLQEPEWDGERFWYYVQVYGGTSVGWASEVYLASWEVATASILLCSDRTGSFDIYRLSPDGTGLTPLTSDPGDETDPSWSPDRQKIVFTSNRTGNSDLYIMNAGGGPWMQLTSGPDKDVHPVWSPDGSRIVFISKRDGDWELFVVNVDGTGLRQLTFSQAWDSYPAWSLDGRSLVYTSKRTGNYDLFLFNLEDGTDRQLTTSPYSDAHPSWSPRGDEIAYTMVVPEGDSYLLEIGALNIYDPAHPRRVTQGEPKGSNRYPTWSPDGKWIVFSSERDGSADLYLIPAKGGPLVDNLTNAPGSIDTAPAW